MYARNLLALLAAVACFPPACRRSDEPTSHRQDGKEPVDRPRHEHGTDPTHLRPFADVEKYIAFLDRAERDAWQKPDDVVAAIGLTGA